MLSQYILREFVPADSIYAGPARVSFGSSKGEISGPGTIRLSPRGRVTMRVEVEDYTIPPEYHDLLMPFVQGSIPKRSGLARRPSASAPERRA
jgi:hypothetical protein